MTTVAPIEKFVPLSAVPDLRHGFLRRVPGVPVDCDKDEALARLGAAHAGAREQLLGSGWTTVTAEQVHGDGVLVVDAANLAETAAAVVPEIDGFVTNLPRVALGIYVADCGAVFLADPVHRAVGLVHSGKNGSALGISVRAIELMRENYGTNPADLVVVLGPCIRPPAYEIDFAAEIRRQVLEVGVPEARFHDCGQCTSLDLENYYSYRIEKGKTGRMLALLGYE